MYNIASSSSSDNYRMNPAVSCSRARALRASTSFLFPSLSPTEAHTKMGGTWTKCEGWNVRGGEHQVTAIVRPQSSRARAFTASSFLFFPALKSTAAHTNGTTFSDSLKTEKYGKSGGRCPVFLPSCVFIHLGMFHSHRRRVSHRTASQEQPSHVHPEHAS